MSTTWFVSRHPGAIQWAARKGILYDRAVDHVSIDMIEKGDMVIGSLPVDLVAELCSRGASYCHMSLNLPRELRGVELDASQLEALDVSLKRFVVYAVSSAGRKPGESCR